MTWFWLSLHCQRTESQHWASEVRSMALFPQSDWRQWSTAGGNVEEEHNTRETELGFKWPYRFWLGLHCWGIKLQHRTSGVTARVTEVHGPSLVEMLRKNTTLKKLYLSHNFLADSGLAYIAKGLIHNTVLSEHLPFRPYPYIKDDCITQHDDQLFPIVLESRGHAGGFSIY